MQDETHPLFRCRSEKNVREMKGIAGNSKDLLERKTFNLKRFIADVYSDFLFRRKIAIEPQDVQR